MGVSESKETQLMRAALEAIESEMAFLLASITECRTGGWSTNLCDPMEKRRNELMQVAYLIRREYPL
jgi:hypothetical protein